MISLYHYSMSGLLTARILVDYFAKVTIIETDPNLDLDSTRAAQRRQAHSYTHISLEILRALFTGFDEEVRSVGGV